MVASLQVARRWGPAVGCTCHDWLARIALGTYTGDLGIGAEVEVRRAQPVPLGEWPAPFGALAGRMPSIEIEDIKAARREALLGTLPYPGLGRPSL